MTELNDVAVAGEISGNVGARKPLPKFALNNSDGAALNFKPNFGVTDAP